MFSFHSLVDCPIVLLFQSPQGVRLDMGRIHPESPDSDPPDGWVLVDALLRQVPDEEEEDEEEEEDDGDGHEDDDDDGDEGYSE